jgi:hypothetical protein
MAERAAAVCAAPKINLDGVDLGSKSMTNIMQSSEDWAQGILKADRIEIKAAAYLNPRNTRNVRNSVGNGNLYGAIRNGVALRRDGWQTRDSTVAKAFAGWIKAINECAEFKGRGSYRVEELPDLAQAYRATAQQIRCNIGELRSEAEVGPQDIQYWEAVANGMAQVASAIGKLHAAVCDKTDPPISVVSLDVQAKKH